MALWTDHSLFSSQRLHSPLIWNHSETHKALMRQLFVLKCSFIITLFQMNTTALTSCSHKGSAHSRPRKKWWLDATLISSSWECQDVLRQVVSMTCATWTVFLFISCASIKLFWLTGACCQANRDKKTDRKKKKSETYFISQRGKDKPFLSSVYSISYFISAAWK